MEIYSKAFLVSAETDPAALKEEIKARHHPELVQTLRTSTVKNAMYATMLAAQTLHAAETGNLLADKAEIDFLLRAAGTTQIARAIELAGTRAGEPFILVVADRRTAPLRLGRTLKPLELERKRLTPKEFAGIERAALLNVARA